MGYASSGHKKTGIEIFKDHDLSVFHITNGTKKYLLVPISLESIQEGNATVREREGAAFFQEKRYLYGE